MPALPRPAIWPQLVTISLLGLGVASCADSSRFGDLFSSSSSSHDQTGAVAQSAPAGHVESQPLPHLAAADSGAPGGGPTSPLRTPSAAPPNWTWEGGTAITIRPGETLDMVSREHGVPVSAIMQANNMRGPVVHPGQHLVIPRYRVPTMAYAPPTTRIATTTPAIGGTPSRPIA